MNTEQELLEGRLIPPVKKLEIISGGRYRIADGCRQILEWRGLSPEMPLERIGIRGFYALISLFHFELVEQKATFGDDAALDAMRVRHRVTKEEMTLYTRVEKKNPGGRGRSSGSRVRRYRLDALAPWRKNSLRVPIAQEGERIAMAVGWTKDGGVQDQIDASVEERVELARSRLPAGESLTRCERCKAPIPDERRKAIPGVRLCVRCQSGAERTR